MARRRKNEPIPPILILLALIAAGLMWLKSEILDKITPDVWAAIAIVGLFLFALWIWSRYSQRRHREAEDRRLEAEAEAATQAARRRHHEYMAWGVERAVSIATHQKWVSPHRLRTQLHLTEKQASEFLQFGASAGLLHQEVNGRYYVTELARSLEPRAIEGPGA